MSRLVQLKQKIRSIKTTKKITHAVRLISMSFYNRMERFDVPLKNYTKHIKNLFIELLDYSPGWKDPLFFPQDLFDTKPLYIVVASSRGLCGGLNSNLFRYIDTSLFIDKQQKPHFVAIGQKAIKFVKEKDMGELVAAYSYFDSNNFMALADDLVERIIGSEVPYSSVAFFSNHVKSFFVQKPIKTTIIPLSLDIWVDPLEEPKQEEKKEEEPNDLLEKDLDAFIWEQKGEQVLKCLSVSYLRSMMLCTLFKSIRAEHAARFLAMENSTNNAEKYLDRLTLQFNKLRQASITKELSELSAGYLAR